MKSFVLRFLEGYNIHQKLLKINMFVLKLNINLLCLVSFCDHFQLQDYIEYMGSTANVILVPSIRDANHDLVFPQVIQLLIFVGGNILSRSNYLVQCFYLYIYFLFLFYFFSLPLIFLQVI